MKVRKLRKFAQEKHGHWTIYSRHKKRSQVKENGKLMFRYFTSYSSGADHVWRDN